MTKQKGICEECKKEYEYEYNPKYPRKYCPECSAAKKQSYEEANKNYNETHEDQVPVVKVGVQVDPKGTVYEKPKSNGLKPYEKDPVGLAVELMCAHTDLNVHAAIQIVKEARKAFASPGGE